MKRIFGLLICVIFFNPGFSFSQETKTNALFPIPLATYQKVRLYPQNTLPATCLDGDLIMLNETSGYNLYLCSQAVWISIESGGNIWVENEIKDVHGTTIQKVVSLKDPTWEVGIGTTKIIAGKMTVDGIIRTTRDVGGQYYVGNEAGIYDICSESEYKGIIGLRGIRISEHKAGFQFGENGPLMFDFEDQGFSIGNTNPKMMFHIGDEDIGNLASSANWSYNSGILLGNGGDGFFFGFQKPSGSTYDATFLWGDESVNSLKFVGSHTNTLNEVMTLTSAGNVGIGTSEPQVKLDVNGGVRVLSEYKFNNIKDMGMSFDAGSNQLFLHNNDFSLSKFNPSRYFVINTDKVGIGIETPVVTLDIGGDMKVGPHSNCASQYKGVVRYKSNSDHNTPQIEYCNGVNWLIVRQHYSVLPGTVCGVNIYDDQNPYSTSNVNVYCDLGTSDESTFCKKQFPPLVRNLSLDAPAHNYNYTICVTSGGI
ncbi:MAG: hypothetical protein HQL25_09010 [Candidatus Omnitrophica bacterium]|nr:hypothetical protein [Candidatus Omnitrophota bacterium]